MSPEWISVLLVVGSLIVGSVSTGAAVWIKMKPKAYDGKERRECPVSQNDLTKIHDIKENQNRFDSNLSKIADALEKVSKMVFESTFILNAHIKSDDLIQRETKLTLDELLKEVKK